MNEYRGVIHVHTKYSDGRGTLRDVLRAAEKCRIDFVIVTDHNSVRLKEKGQEGWHDGRLVLVGEEVSPSYWNHFLALNLEEKIGRRGGDPREFLRETKKQKGIAIISHPMGRRSVYVPFLKVGQWHKIDGEDFDGIELWSNAFDWFEPIRLWNFPFYILKKQVPRNGPDRRVLALWDELIATRKVSAIGTLDAHMRNLLPFGLFRLFSYNDSFRTIRTHILSERPFSGNFDKDRTLVYEALKQGHSFIANDYLAEATGFRFAIEGSSMGEVVPFVESHMKLSAWAPREASLRLIRNGLAVKEAFGQELSIELDKSGVYRLEAYLDGRSWVYTNPVYLRNQKPVTR